jgi:hypothetical protein
LVCLDHRRALEADLHLEDAVPGGDLQPVNAGVGRDRRLAIGGRDGLVAGLRALEGPASTAKVGTTLCQTSAGSLSKSSENNSSLFSAIGAIGTGTWAPGRLTGGRRARRMPENDDRRPTPRR